MPGPQLTQAVAVCARVKAALPHVPIVWGGYFPTQHTDTVLRAPYVDFVIRSQGERPLLQLIEALTSGGVLEHRRRPVVERDGVGRAAESSTTRCSR